MPRNIQTFLPDGTLEGIRIIELSESSIKAFVVPRIKLNDIKNRPELSQPALYLLINSADNQVYIGESESFFHRIKNHDQSKDFWDTAIAIVSSTNSLEKSDVKYLESLAVEAAQETAAMEVLNKTIPARNTIHEFKLHSLQAILADVALIAELLGFSLLSSREDEHDTWYCKTKKNYARAQYRGDKFVVLAGSLIDTSYAPGWKQNDPAEYKERQNLIEKHSIDKGDGTVELHENISLKTPNHAGRIITGRSVNAWTLWKNDEGRTMDEIMRKGISI